MRKTKLAPWKPSTNSVTMLLCTKGHIFVSLFQLSKMQKELEIPDFTQLNIPVLIFSAMLEDFQGVGIERHISQKHSSHLLQLGLCTPLPDIINPDKIESKITHIKNCSLN